MSAELDRDGVFRAVPFVWRVSEPKKDSDSVAIIIEWDVTEWWDQSAGEWVPWPEGYGVTGYHYVVKKDGGINETTVTQLAKSIGWDGDLDVVAHTEPPNVVAQVNVKSETYNGKSRRKVQWVNPGDHQPSAGGASPEEVKQMGSRYGSLLRASAAAAAKAAKPVAAPPRPTTAPDPVGAPAAGSTGDDGLPF